MMRFSFFVGLLLATTVSSQANVCQTIEVAISTASNVFYPGSIYYADDISHWSQLSIQQSTCSVEPGTPEDVGKILQILGKTRTPFAVKGGGHAMNPGFSSTTGVHIAMSRFSEVDYDNATQTATIGTGLTWDDVYAALDPYNVNVVGARVPGIGVAGFALGGGFSWLTNQYGLCVDTIVAMELVTPDGVVTNVTQDSNPDLFFALKGTQNNLGVVTRIVFKTFPQGKVWGGQITYGADQVAAVNNATVQLRKTLDPKAELESALSYTTDGEVNAVVMMFYDGPSRPPGVFEDFLNIPAISSNVQTRSFKDHVASYTGIAEINLRTAFHTVSLLKFSQPVVDALANETTYWGRRFAEQVPGQFIVSYYLESFLPDILTHNTEPTAYPPSRDATLFPLCILYGWTSSDTDEYGFESMRLSAERITDVAVADGQAIRDVALYPNYALFDTPLERLFGENVERLKEIKARVDPDDVMGLAGGFKL